MHSQNVEAAIDFAKKAHACQMDKAGRPYFGHLERVASRCDTPEEAVVGYLHDSIEDTDTTREDIAALFGEETAESVSAMTHLDGESYEEYVRRVKADPVARKVKISDLIDNSNLSRLSMVTQNDVARQAKYNRALQYLIE